ncbi:MAG: outer membrane beta-barrel protein [Bacteroidetes bacterium]|nr:outer membrane beta-barrel protein [Bacteroidota bacterium]MBS1973458.1 outer membrane beta-barrel protein [Bacteroidota bacterium]
MRKILFLIAALTIFTSAFSQEKDSVISKPKKKDWSKIDLSHRANDHFMAQIGYAGWSGVPDTLSTGGLSRSFNFYFLYDFPFKSDPRFSVGAGVGIGSANIFFKNQAAPIESTPRQDASGGNHFKKYKIVNTYLEIPLELRYAMDPENTNKSWKFAVGAKVGVMLSAYAKGKNVLNGSGQSVDGSVYKISSKAYYNGIRFAGTARISKGPVGIYAQYQPTILMKTSIAGIPPVYPFEIGICFSGL